MKTVRIFRKLFGIFLGTLGLGFLSSSCGKLHDCKCTVSGGGYTDTYIISAGEKCDEMDREYTDNGKQYTLDCEKS